MTIPLLSIFPTSTDLLALEPEDLGGVLLEIIPGISQSAGFNLNDLLSQLYPVQPGGYSRGSQSEVSRALTEAISWLQVQGIIIRNMHQPAEWFLLSRRGLQLKSRTDIETFRKGRALPLELLQPALADKVHHLFVRGDHDTAVFQAFKEVEVAVRKAGKFPDSLLGRDLMQKAFHPENGPLRDKSVIPAERESEMFLFSGAIGHAKNPTGHRHVNLSLGEAARLIVFASYLLDIVSERAASCAV